VLNKGWLMGIRNGKFRFTSAGGIQSLTTSVRSREAASRDNHSTNLRYSR